MARAEAWRMLPALAAVLGTAAAPNGAAWSAPALASAPPPAALPVPAPAERLAGVFAVQSSPPAAILSAAPQNARRPSDGTEAWLSVWIDLDEPELASLPADQADARAALRTRILAQQAQVMAQLRDLGALEQARLQVVRNAISVRLPRTKLADAAALPGVRGVRPVQHRNRTLQAPP